MGAALGSLVARCVLDFSFQYLFIHVDLGHQNAAGLAQLFPVGGDRMQPGLQFEPEIIVEPIDLAFGLIGPLFGHRLIRLLDDGRSAHLVRIRMHDPLGIGGNLPKIQGLGTHHRRQTEQHNETRAQHSHSSPRCVERIDP